MKKSNLINEIFIFLFVIMLVLPNLFFNRVPNAVSEIENRVLAQKPEIVDANGNLNNEYIQEFEDYFDDNIGFKQKATELNLISKYKLFGVLDMPNWIMGKDNNLFYTTNGEDIKTYAGANLYDEDTLNEMACNLEYMNLYFRQLGCKTYNMFIPNKEAVYSELYNPYVFHSNESRMDLFEKYLSEHTDLNTLNIKGALIENKTEQLYYKSYDASHWNMNGAYIGYMELMKRLLVDSPELKILSKDDFDIVVEEFIGLMQYQSTNKVISKNFSLKDNIFYYNLKEGTHAVLDTAPLNGKYIDPNLNFYHFHNDVIDNEDTLMIVGDSYVYCFMLPLLAESFQDVYFVRNTAADEIVQMSMEINPTIFVFEVAERVFNKNYFDLMKGFSNYIVFDVNQYISLEQEAEVHIDWPILVDNCLPISDDDYTCIMGWAWDYLNQKKPGKVLAEVNGNFYEAEFYYRENLKIMGDDYCDSAFQVYIKSDFLRQNDEIAFYVITEGKEKYLQHIVRIAK